MWHLRYEAAQDAHMAAFRDLCAVVGAGLARFDALVRVPRCPIAHAMKRPYFASPPRCIVPQAPTPPCPPIHALPPHFYMWACHASSAPPLRACTAATLPAIRAPALPPCLFCRRHR